MLIKRLATLGLVAVLGAASFGAQAQDEFLTEQELQRAFERAVESFGRTPSAVPDAQPTLPEDTTAETTDNDEPAAVTTSPAGDADVKIGIKNRRPFGKRDGVPLEYVALNELRVSIDVENVPLENVVKMIVEQAEASTGPWGVKWRLADDNRKLMNERVNLTAETNFEEFMTYMVDRINNMTGVRLFVRVFDDARLILITDTY